MAIVGAWIATLGVVGFAHATLGERADSIVSDRARLSSVHQASASLGRYTVEEMASESTTVREYVSPSGVVFGIAWNGNVHPDLTPLLGAYSGEYITALRAAPRTQGRRSKRLATDNVVVEMWGHMRNLRGRAYCPALVPDGVRVDEIK